MNEDRYKIFKSFLIKSPDGCWEWLGAKDREGYGFFKVDGIQVAIKARKEAEAHA